jgi:hypothetical protein
MKHGQLVIGGIAVGAALGLGIGYLLGIDSEKRKQWMQLITQKLSKARGDEYYDEEEYEEDIDDEQ